MSDKTEISWTDATWPVVTGCTPVSEGCDNCYAARFTSARLAHLPAYAGLAEHGKFNGQVRLLPDRLDWPSRWRKPRKIFVSDMADLFHEGVPDEYIAQVWQRMAATPRHTFQVLTKRHARMRAWLARCARWDGYITHNGEAVSSYGGGGEIVGYPTAPKRRPGWDTGPRGGKLRYPPQDAAWGWPLPNAWCGVSAENQKWVDIRTPALLETPAVVRFLSCEPLLGETDLRGLLGHGIGWVICGGESGPGHRVMKVDWLARIVQQCRDAGVPVWVKQDSGPRSGKQGRIPDDLWVHEFPPVVTPAREGTAA